MTCCRGFVGTSGHRIRRLVIGIAAALLAALGLPLAALAATCGAGYHYAGETSSNNFHGLQGELGNVSGQSLNGAVHIINYYDLSDTSYNCNGNGQCWIQAGFGQGNVGGYVAPASNHAYEETNDLNGYNVNWNPTGYVSGSDHSGYISLYIQSQSGGNTLYYAYSYSTSGSHFLGSAWLPSNSLTADINTETEYSGSATCATLNSPVYYGANATGGYDSGTFIEYWDTGSSTWYAVNDPGWSTLTGGNMNYAELAGHRTAFEAY